jgi:hypothetical protein
MEGQRAARDGGGVKGGACVGWGRSGVCSVRFHWMCRVGFC